MKYFALPLSITLLLTACDGGFSYKGNIESSAGVELTGCTEQLEGIDGSLLDGPFPIAASDLHGGMVVAPYDRDYVLVLTCKDHDPYKVPVKYGSQVLPGKDVELGNVVLQFNGRPNE